MRDPCPHCGLPKMSMSRLDTFTKEIVIDTKDHNCPAWAAKPALSIFETDTAFIREAWNTAEGLARYREGKTPVADDCQCATCVEERSWA
jgi:hypothetical protein